MPLFQQSQERLSLTFWLARARETCYIRTEHGEPPRSSPACRGERCHGLTRRERQLRRGAGDPGARRARDARAALRPARPRSRDGAHRHPRARARQPDLPRARAGDRDAGRARRARVHPLQHRRGGVPRSRLRAHAARPPCRGNDLHLLRDDESPRRARPLSAARGRGSADRLRERRDPHARRPVGRRRRARGGRDRDPAPARARPRAHRVRGGAGALPAHAVEGGRARDGARRRGHRPRRPRRLRRLQHRGRRQSAREAAREA